MFQKELNPPVIQVTMPVAESTEMDTEEASAPPLTPELPVINSNRNPFLNANETMEDVRNEGSETMVMDDDSPSLPVKETNPFRRLSWEREESERNPFRRLNAEREESERNVTQDVEMGSERKLEQDEEMES